MSHIDISHEQRHIEIRIDGTVVAESERPTILREGSIAPRTYFTADEVRVELLEPSDTTSFCPHKGTAHYHSVRIGDEVHTDVVWHYPEPIHDVAPIAGLFAFYDERVQTLTEGPVT